jgi:hypothetical protein
VVVAQADTIRALSKMVESVELLPQRLNLPLATLAPWDFGYQYYQPASRKGMF